MKNSTTPNTVNGLLTIKGADAGKFLQGQLTCDIEQLTLNKSLPGAYCSPKGRIRTNFILLKQSADSYLMLLPKSQTTFLVEALSPFVAFFQCTIEDVTEQWSICGLNSNESIAEEQTDLLTSSWEVSTIDEIVYISLPGEHNRWICLSHSPINQTDDTYVPLDDSNWMQQDMLQGLVWIGEDNRDKFLPHDLSLPDLGAVSFTKGCYVGQEIVARMEYRGEPKYTLALLQTEATSEKPQEKLIQITDSNEQLKIGETACSLHLDDNRWLICASMKRELLKQQKIQLLSGARSIICTILIPE